MSFVFISYSHDDSDYAHKLADSLEAKGLEVCIDDRIDYGTRWPHVIQEKADDCGALIVIMTPRSYKSKWVQNELARAGRKNKAVFPLLLEGDGWLSVEATQWVDVRHGKLPPARFYTRLARVVPVRPEPAPASRHGKSHAASEYHSLQSREMPACYRRASQGLSKI